MIYFWPLKNFEQRRNVHKIMTKLINVAHITCYSTFKRCDKSNGTCWEVYIFKNQTTCGQTRETGLDFKFKIPQKSSS